MTPLQVLSSNAELGRVAPVLLEAVAPAVSLIPEEISEEPKCRLGGRPNFPTNHPWPEWNGRPLAFIAQLDLAAVPVLADLPLPASGSLFFFYEGGQAAWGFRPEDRGSAQVVCLPESLDTFPLRDFPEGVPEECRFQGVTLDVSQIHDTLPDTDHSTVEALELTEEEREAYFDACESCRETLLPTWHRLGGYPEQIQGDPLLEAQLASNGIDCGGPEGYEKGRELGLNSGTKDWRLLLQVDSDDDAGMMWGDLGRIYFLIRTEDLASGSFDKIWLSFQCS